MNYRTIDHTALIFTGSIADLNNFEKEIAIFLEKNRGNNRALVLMINSTGGITEHVLALCGLLHLVKNQGHKVYVHILGQLCHFTYLIGTAADHLIMEPNASLVFGQPQISSKGNPWEIENEIVRNEELYGDLVSAMVEKSKGKLPEATIRGWKAIHITAQKAHEWGLCDEVAEMPTAVTKSDKPEHLIRILGSMGDDTKMFDHMISLNKWLHDDSNADRPIRTVLTSHGGTVTLALSFFGMLLEAQRQGHHLTIEVTGQAYSSALWFTTCALGSGTVEIDKRAKFMFHAPYRESFSGRLDEIRDLLSIEIGVYHQTRALLQRAPGFTDDLLAVWERGPDKYFNAKEAVQMGLGTLVGE